MSTIIQGGGFPSQVNVQPAFGVEGDFASTNPRMSVDAGNAKFVAGASGVTIGAFAWQDPVLTNTLNSFGPGTPIGFVHREQQALITVFLAYQTMLVPQGLPVAAFNGGDFWVRNNGAVTSVYGMSAYAMNANGYATFNVTGTPPSGASCTGGTLAKVVSATTGGALPTTNTITASIASGVTGATSVMTVTAVGAGVAVAPGAQITGTGIDPQASVYIVAQLTGATIGGVGTYSVSLDFQSAVASTTITMSGGTLTLTGANTTGVFAVGQVISGTNIPTGTTITALLSATTGAAGTYAVSNVATTAATASTITAANAMFLTVDSSSTGAWLLNDLLTGAGVGTGTVITATAAQNANLTGLGGAGTYLTSNFVTALTAQTIGVQSAVETTWRAMSVGAPGELVKIRNSVNY